MTTGTISVKNLKNAVQAVHIPPVYYFLVVITLVGVTLDQLFASGNILSNPIIMMNILNTVSLSYIIISFLIHSSQYNPHRKYYVLMGHKDMLVHR